MCIRVKAIFSGGLLMEKHNKLHYAWIILLSVALIRGFSGPVINASSGLFLKPVSEEIGVGIGQLSLYLSMSSIATLIWLPIAGNILNKYNVKFVALFGVLMQTLAFMAMGFMDNVWGWYVLAVPLAMGGAILVNLLGPVLVNRWFSSNIGLVMGLLMTITSLFGAISQPLLTNLIDGKGWRFTYKISGAFSLLFIAIIIFIFLKNKPADKGLLPYKSKKALDLQKNSQKNAGISGVPLKIAMKSSAFYMLLFFIVIITGFAAFSQHITTYGLNLGFSITTLGKALSLSMIGSAVGSILIGIFSDKIGIIPTCICIMGIGFISILLFLFGGTVFFTFAVACFFHGLATSSIGVVAPILTTDFFGAKDYEKLFSFTMMGAPLASIVLMPAYGFIYDWFGGYKLVFFFLLTILVLGGIIILLGKRSSIKLKSAQDGDE